MMKGKRAMRIHSVIGVSVFALVVGASLASRPAADTLAAKGEFHHASVMVDQLTATAKDWLSRPIVVFFSWMKCIVSPRRVRKCSSI